MIMMAVHIVIRKARMIVSFPCTGLFGGSAPVKSYYKLANEGMAASILERVAGCFLSDYG
jgi:hypothetical protein